MAFCKLGMQDVSYSDHLDNSLVQISKKYVLNSHYYLTISLKKFWEILFPNLSGHPHLEGAQRNRLNETILLSINNIFLVEK